MSRRYLMGATAVGLYLLGMGFLCGVLVDHIRYDRQRTAVLRRLEKASRQAHARLMVLEQETAAVGEPPR